MRSLADVQCEYFVISSLLLLRALDDEFFDDPPKNMSFATQLKMTIHIRKS